jgi:hypothetical protein
MSFGNQRIQGDIYADPAVRGSQGHGHIAALRKAGLK